MCMALGLVSGVAQQASAQCCGFTSIDYPDARYTNARGINRAGDIVGRYDDSENVTHGFFLDDEGFRAI